MDTSQDQSAIHAIQGMPLAAILVATDFSNASEQALGCAVDLARAYHAHIFLAHVLTSVNEFGRADAASQAYQAERRAAEQGMAAILSSKRMEGVSHEVLLKEGFFWQTLDELIREKKIDLVAVGTQGVRRPDHEFMGSSAELVFRHADCPVLTAGPEIGKNSRPSEGFKNIFFATDFGRATTRAAFCAFSLARQFGGSLTLLHVADPTECRPTSGSAMLGETTRIRLAELVPDEWRESFRVECAVQYGDAAEKIVRFARDRGVDLIVMGARPGRPLTTHLPQSIVYAVAVSAPCPLITVRV